MGEGEERFNDEDGQRRDDLELLCEIELVGVFILGTREDRENMPRRVSGRSTGSSAQKTTPSGHLWSFESSESGKQMSKLRRRVGRRRGRRIWSSAGMIPQK